MEPVLNIYLENKPFQGHDSTLKVIVKGDPVLLTKMIRTAMQSRQDVAAAFIASVVDYAKEEGFDCGELSQMVKF